MMHRPLSKRLGYLQTRVLGPWKALDAKLRPHPLPYRLRMLVSDRILPEAHRTYNDPPSQDWKAISAANSIIGLLPKLTHPATGLIVAPGQSEPLLPMLRFIAPLKSFADRVTAPTASAEDVGRIWGSASK